MKSLVKNTKRELLLRTTTFLSCFMLVITCIDKAYAINLGGTIANVLFGAVELIVNLVIWGVCLLISMFVDLGLQAMAFDWDKVQTLLGDYGLISPSSLEAARTTASSHVTSFLLIIGFAIYGVLLVAEIVKVPAANIMGDDRVSRPGVIAVRGLVYGASVMAAIPFARAMLKQAGKIYAALFDGFLSETSVTSITVDKFRLLGTSLLDATLSTNLMESASGEESGFFEVIMGLASSIIAFAILMVVLWNFAKLVLECAQRIGQLVLLVYLSPIAAACGVSSSLSGIASQWLKTFFSTLLLWIVDILLLAASANIIAFDPRTLSGVDDVGFATRINWVIWAYFAFAFLKASQQMDDLFNALGANVVRSSGSLLGDFMSMSQLPKAIAGAAKTAVQAGSAIGNPIKAIANAAKGRPDGPARTGTQIASDMVKAGFKATPTGQLVDKAASLGRNAGNLVNSVRGEHQTARDLINDENAYYAALDSHSRRVNAIQDSFRDKKGALPDTSSAAGQKMASQLEAENRRFAESINSIHPDGNAAIKKSMAESVIGPNGKSMKSMGYEASSFDRDMKTGEASVRFEKTDPQTGMKSAVNMSNIKARDGIISGNITGGYTVSGTTKNNSSAEFSKIDSAGKETKYSVSEAGTLPNGAKSFKVEELNDAGKRVSTSFYTGSSSDTTALDAAQGLADGTYSGLETKQVKQENEDGSTTYVTMPQEQQIASTQYYPGGTSYGHSVVLGNQNAHENYETDQWVVRGSLENESGDHVFEATQGRVGTEAYAFVQEEQSGFMTIHAAESATMPVQDIVDHSSMFTRTSTPGEHTLRSLHSEVDQQVYEGGYEAFQGTYQGEKGIFVTTTTADGTFIDFLKGGTANDTSFAKGHAMDVITGRFAEDSSKQRVYQSTLGGTDGLYQAVSSMERGLDSAEFGQKLSFGDYSRDIPAKLGVLFKKRKTD